jgi:hypothetical protein
MTSGAMYSSVPTNELVRKSAMQLLVSMVGRLFGAGLLEMPPLALRPPARIMPGTPAASDCFERSKSESMMWPDW